MRNSPRRLVNGARNHGPIIAAWGDSTTFGYGAAYPAQSYPARLGDSYTPFRPVYNGGFSGETSTEIRARFLARPAHLRGVTTVIWVGHNNRANGATVKSDIAAMVADEPGAIVLTLLFASYDTGSNLAQFQALNTQIAAIYGSRCLDVIALLQSHNDGSANDLADVAAGLVPRSLQFDELHLNSPGYAVIDGGVKTKLDSLSA